MKFDSKGVIVSRCGYTGEDGFEISVCNSQIEQFMESLWPIKSEAGEQVCVPVGLGARDSLRLEAGLCLYGHELDEDISPIEAMLAWTISKRRKQTFGFLGDHLVKQHIAEGVSRKRCGFVGDKIPIREGTELFLPNEEGKAGQKVGMVTSGTKGPSINKAIGMAYVDVPHNKFKVDLVAVVRGKEQNVKITKMPFWPSNYYKK